MVFFCESCGYTSSIKYNFDRHYQNKKHVEINNKRKSITHNSFQNKNRDHLFQCQFCSKVFTKKSSLIRHEAERCKQNEKLQMQKLADLLNKMQKQKSEMKGIQKENIQMKRQIDKLTTQLQLQNINDANLPLLNTIPIINGENNTINQNSGGYTNTIHGNNNTTIQLLNYNNTDFDFLKDHDYIQCIQDNNHCVKKLIETVHFNKNKPQNMNIYISSIKGKFIMVYRENAWQIHDRKKQIDDLYDTNEFQLEQWYDECCEKYPDIIKSFTRYLNNKDNDDTLIKNVKSEIEMMLYNKRGIVLRNRDKTKSTYRQEKISIPPPTSYSDSELLHMG